MHTVVVDDWKHSRLRIARSGHVNADDVESHIGKLASLIATSTAELEDSCTTREISGDPAQLRVTDRVQERERGHSSTPRIVTRARRRAVSSAAKPRG